MMVEDWEKEGYALCKILYSNKHSDVAFEFYGDNMIGKKFMKITLLSCVWDIAGFGGAISLMI